MSKAGRGARRRFAVASAIMVVVAACRSQASAPSAPPLSVERVDEQPHVSGAAPDADRERLVAHVRFLADDAQRGRAPGSAADRRVQDYIIEQMRAAGLQAGFGDSYRQPLSVMDGVRPLAGAQTELVLGKQPIPHAVLPFTARGAAADAPLVHVGYGIAPTGVGSGDYQSIAESVRGKIVVARAGAPDDPHLNPAQTRPQSKLIAARDHGAVGFILWDPNTDVPYPNHGEAADLGLPAVFVGRAGTDPLLRAFGWIHGGEDALVAARKPGGTSREKLRLSTPVEPVTLLTANVMGVLPGADSRKVLVIGAHMDHLGDHSRYSLSPDVQAIHNGADDNASGVAALLEVCRGLASLPQTQRSFDTWCVAFAAEEMGLLGSKHLVQALPDRERARIIAMLNFDMVGRLQDELTVSGVGTSSVWPELLERLRGDLRIATTEDGYGPSDHGSFYEVKIPVLHFFTGAHEDYHKPTDDIDKIDFDGLEQITNYALRLTHALAREAVVPDYRETQRPAPRGGSFRVSLGTMPDYAADVDGVRLSGVRAGGPADVAGLRKGDIIVRIGKRPIHNLDDYMVMFNVLEPGAVVEVEIERDGKRSVLQLTPAGR